MQAPVWWLCFLLIRRSLSCSLSHQQGTMRNHQWSQLAGSQRKLPAAQREAGGVKQPQHTPTASPIPLRKRSTKSWRTAFSFFLVQSTVTTPCLCKNKSRRKPFSWWAAFLLISLKAASDEFPPSHEPCYGYHSVIHHYPHFFFFLQCNIKLESTHLDKDTPFGVKGFSSQKVRTRQLWSQTKLQRKIHPAVQSCAGSPAQITACAASHQVALHPFLFSPPFPDSCESEHLDPNDGSTTQSKKYCR